MSVRIFSVNHLDEPLELYRGPLGRVVVEGRGKPNREDRPYGITEIPDELFQARDVGWGQKENVRFSGLEHARDLAQRHADWGIGYTTHAEPTQEELAAATARYRKFLELKFAQAEAEWSKSHKHDRIETIARVAARVLGESPEWEMGTGLAKVRCPNCEAAISPKAAVCRECGAILDRDRAMQFGFLPASTASKQASKQAGL